MLTIFGEKRKMSVVLQTQRVVRELGKATCGPLRHHRRLQQMSPLISYLARRWGWAAVSLWKQITSTK